MATISAKSPAQASGLTKQVYDNITKTYGSREPHKIYQLMGHTPEFLGASWPRSRMLYGMDTRYSIRDKHAMTMAISATNNCEYCVRIHTERLFQLGMSREQVVEILMVVDVMNGYDKFAEGVRLGDKPTIPAPESGQATEGLEPGGIHEMMSYDLEYMRASRAREQLCFFGEGKLGVKLKHQIALCVAATNGNDYFVRHHTQRLRDQDATEEDLVEILLIIDLSCGYNRYVQGMQIELEAKPFGANAEANKAKSVAR